MKPALLLIFLLCSTCWAQEGDAIDTVADTEADSGEGHQHHDEGPCELECVHGEKSSEEAPCECLCFHGFGGDYCQTDCRRYDVGYGEGNCWEEDNRWARYHWTSTCACEKSLSALSIILIICGSVAVVFLLCALFYIIMRFVIPEVRAWKSRKEFVLKGSGSRSSAVNRSSEKTPLVSADANKGLPSFTHTFNGKGSYNQNSADHQQSLSLRFCISKCCKSGLYCVCGSGSDHFGSFSIKGGCASISPTDKAGLYDVRIAFVKKYGFSAARKAKLSRLNARRLEYRFEGILPYNCALFEGGMLSPITLNLEGRWYFRSNLPGHGTAKIKLSEQQQQVAAAKVVHNPNGNVNGAKPAAKAAPAPKPAAHPTAAPPSSTTAAAKPAAKPAPKQATV